MGKRKFELVVCADFRDGNGEIYLNEEEFGRFRDEDMTLEDKEVLLDRLIEVLGIEWSVQGYEGDDFEQEESMY